jgi:histidyl-tRNA synthetase
MISISIDIARQLRDKGISVDFDLLRRGMSKSLKYADIKHAEQVIIVGPKELAKNTITLRDMKTGNQEIVTISDISEKLKKP